MKESEKVAGKRIKQVRERLGYTQKKFAESLGIKNNIADIERNKTRVSGYVITQLLKVYNVNPMWVYGYSPIRDIRDLNYGTNPKVITLNNENTENMVLVDQKASAGYPENIHNPTWFDELPAFDFPLPEYRNATYRGFQVEGDSMLPYLQPNDWIIAKAVDNLSHIANRTMCVVVLKDSILVKQLHKSEQSESIILISLNTKYSPIEIAIRDIQEIWEVSSKLSFDISQSTGGDTSESINDIHLAIEKIHKDISRLKVK